MRRYGLVSGLELLDAPLGATKAIQALSANPNVLYAEFDHVVRPTLLPNDTKLGYCWGLSDPANFDIDAPQAWEGFTGDPNFIVAVIDTGLQTDHLDLADNVWVNPGEVPGNGLDDDGNGFVDDVNGWDFYDRDADPTDTKGHGTHVGGTIGAVGNNGLGVAGVNWRCKIMPLRFLGQNGGYTSDAILALEYATYMGARVSNNSWGGSAADQALKDAINAAQSRNHLFVAAAGNSAGNSDLNPLYPAAFDCENIVSVAATDRNGALASFSNYGATTVDLAAPGVDVWSTYPGNALASMSGTSMASPHVAGVAALLWGKNPDWNWADVKARLLESVRPLGSLAGMCVSGGLVNAYVALVDGPLPPSVAIASPLTNKLYVQGTPVLFSGQAHDGQDGDISDEIRWRSDIQGELGTGASFSRSDLRPGHHTIIAEATNSRGTLVSHQVYIFVSNTAPSVSIQSPSSGTAVSEGVSVTFSGTASDEQDGNLSGSIRWSSDLQGALGDGATVTRSDLVPGTHRVTAKVSDSGSKTVTAEVVLSVIAAGESAPTLTILSPSTGSSSEAGSEVIMSGLADDVQEGDLSGAISWSSSLNGELGVGPSIVRNDLKQGTHVIKARVVDSQGLIGEASVSITIAPKATMPPAAPSSVSASRAPGGVQVTWRDNSSTESGFEVERERKNGKNWISRTLVFRTAADVVTFLDSPGSGTWRYRVRAFNSVGVSSWSSWSNSVKQ